MSGIAIVRVNRTGIGHASSVDPVVFGGAAGDEVESFPVGSAGRRGSKCSTATGQGSHDAIVIGRGNHGRLSVARMAFRSDLVGVDIRIVGALKVIDEPADSPSPFHQSSGIGWRSPAAMV